MGKGGLSSDIKLNFIKEPNYDCYTKQAKLKVIKLINVL